MSLAEELLADLDDVTDQVEDEQEYEGEDVVEAVAEMDTSENQSVKTIAKLLDSDKVEHYYDEFSHVSSVQLYNPVPSVHVYNNLLSV